MQGPAIPSRHPKYRTKLCRNFASGDCPFGQKCSFLHPAPKIDPPVGSPPAQRLFPWNPLLLSQLLALSNQQAAMKKMPRRSPPRPQGPQLVEEDPSPTTSLLLSKSDCTPSEQAPQSKRSHRKKKHPCRHFVRTGGWCPAGANCRFHHDVDALPSPDVRKTEQVYHSATDEPGEGRRTISGGILMGRQCPYPPIQNVNQTHAEPPRYPEREPMRQYPPLYWPSYAWQPYRPCYTSIPAATALPVPATAPSTVTQQNVYPPPPPLQAVPPSEPRTAPPMGSYEMNGTTYFSVMPSVPAQPPMPYSLPVHALPHSPTIPPAYPYYAPPGMPAGYYDANQTMTPTLQTSTAFDPFASDRMEPTDLPVVPLLEDYQMSPVEQDVRALPPMGASPAAADTAPAIQRSTMTRPVPEDEFPYQPPKEQRVGHARRISVNIKKHARARSG